MKIGIIGLPTVGKTTLFNLMTGKSAETGTFYGEDREVNQGKAPVPDKRIDKLSELYQPKRTTYAQVEFLDIPGLNPNAGKEANRKFLRHVQDADALVHVVRAFSDPSIPAINQDIDPVRDLEQIHTELLLADLTLVETRLERIKNNKKPRPEETIEKAVLEKYRAALEKELPLATVELSDEEREAVYSLAFLTDKPTVIVVNGGDDAPATGEFPQKDRLMEYAKAHGSPVVVVSAKIEAEINAMDPEDREVFMEEMGIAESGLVKVTQAAFKSLGLISFFTVGKDEVRAWPIKKGLNARKGAGKIHSDIERGFIRAEVVSYSDFIQAGSWEEAQKQGRIRLEPAEYLLQDGDIVNFRFNV
ncbi:MAG: redox-regulated ATPase YchF [Firmicutes bacterium]|nr:redox-regulated ATPase YchF [Bacillota bacterium]